MHEPLPGLTSTPAPPYYAVIFTSLRKPGEEGYGQTSDAMMALAAQQPGYLGVETAGGGENGCGITVSYWESTEAIANWKKHADHRTAQAAGRASWYRAYNVRICRVERAYSFGQD